jgi:isoquinoline 1-oxidoreductase alpha subunit
MEPAASSSRRMHPHPCRPQRRAQKKHFRNPRTIATATIAHADLIPGVRSTTQRKTEMITLSINGRDMEVDADPSTPLLWALRDNLQMTGTKFGCGSAFCGACTVHLNGQAIRSCVTPISAAAGQKITTIEAMESDKVGKAVEDAWVRHDVPQCGYCQSGQVMSATALLKANSHPTDADIVNAMSGNICRCGTYQRIHAAIKTAAKSLA